MGVWKFRLGVIIPVLMMVVFSAAAVEIEVKQDDEGNNVYRIPLAWMMDAPSEVKLTGQMSTFDFNFPISKSMVIRSARLDLSFLNTINVLESRSQLQVRLDDAILSVVPVSGANPSGHIRIKLPASRLNPGYHRITLAGIHHYREVCEDNSPPELWTQIDTLKSFVEVVATENPDVAGLDDLDEIFDPTQWSSFFNLTVLTPSSFDVNKAEARATTAAMAVQGTARILNYRDQRIVYKSFDAVAATPEQRAQLNFPGLPWNFVENQHALLIASMAELQGILNEDLIDKIAGATLAVFQQENGTGKKILLITGRDEEELRLAASVFARNRTYWPVGQWATIENYIPAVLPAYATPQWLDGGKVYKFSELGWSDITLESYSPKNLVFWLPPDAFTGRDTEMVLHLNLAYRSGLDPSSTLNIELNDVFERSIAFNNKEGDVFYDYQIKIPFTSLQPGRNILKFTPIMNLPAASGECTASPGGSVLMSFFADSAIELPKYDHYAELPNLKLLSAGGFPFANPVVEAVDSPAIVLPNINDSSISAALTLLSQITQSSGRILPDVLVTSGVSSVEGRNLLVVSTMESIPTLLAAAPAVHLSNGGTEALVKELSKAGGAEKKWFWTRWKETWDDWGSGLYEFNNSVDYLGKVNLDISPGHAFVTQFQSPLTEGKSVLLLTAVDDNMLYSAAHELADDGFWFELHGDTAWWTPGEEKMFRQSRASMHSLSEPYIHGAKAHPDFLVYFFSKHPEFWVISILVVTAALGLMLTLFVIYRRRKWNS